MTLQRYDPHKLDQFALRLFDLAAMMREMAATSREHGIADLAVHDKKALEAVRGHLYECLESHNVELYR